jgi:hypothetical protein
MRNKHIIFGLLLIALALGCRKTEEVITPPEYVAGKGGKNTMIVSAKHYEKQLDSCWVYLKYNTLTMPKNMAFDDSAWVKNVNGRFQVKFDSLTRGKYFIYCVGHDRDTLVFKPNDSLWGSGSLHIIDTMHTYDMYISTINWYDFTHNYEYH